MHAPLYATKKLSDRGGFTIVELLVVMAIISIMMTLAATVLRTAGTGRSIESGVELMESMVREAQSTAMGNDTYARLVIASDSKNNSKNSPHLRYMVVQLYKKDSKGADGSNIAPRGRWVSTSAGMTLPPGVYFSPHYSTPLQWTDGSSAQMLGQDSTRLTGKGEMRVYYVLFDEKGRFVSPVADPLTPTRAFRLVLISARRGAGRRAHDGLIPTGVDSQKRPVGAGGIVVWPRGDTSLLRTKEQIFGQ